MFFNSHAVSDRQGLFFCENGSAGVTFFLRVIPVLVIAGEVQINLALLQLTFLNTEQVRIGFLEEIKEALCDTGTQAIHVPGDHFHDYSSTSTFLISLVRISLQMSLMNSSRPF